MPVLLDTRLELNRTDLVDHMIRTAAEVTEWAPHAYGEFGIPAHFARLESRTAGSATEFPPDASDPGSAPDKIQLNTHWRRRYRVFKDHSSYTNTEIIVPVQHFCSVRIESLLFADPALGADQRTLLQQEFAQADAGSPPIAAILGRLAEAGISDEQFWVVPQVVVKRYRRVEHDHYQRRLASLRHRNQAGEYFGGSEVGGQPVPDWIADNPLHPVLEHEEHLPSAPTVDSDAPREVARDSDIGAAMDQLIESARGSVECREFVQKTPERLATLLRYPEFRVVWKRRQIKIGCVRVTISYPQLQIRWTDAVLYFVLATAVDVVRAVETVARTCGIAAFLSSGIVAYITGNFAAALKAFKAAFVYCVERRLEQMAPCLLPELIIRKEPGNWQRL